MDQLTQIPLDQIETNGNVRTFDPTGPDIVELSASMQRGQQQPVRVHQDNGHYLLDFGHRRLAAARLLEWEAIQAIVSPSAPTPSETVVDQFHENEYRQEMSYTDKARTYQQLMEHGLSQKEIAERLGVSEKDVSLGLATLRAPEKLQKALDEGRISPSAVEPLLSQDPDIQEELADAAIAAKSVRKVRNLVKTRKLQDELGDTDVVEMEFDDEVDPLELLAVTALDEAIEHLRMAADTEITSRVVFMDIQNRLSTIKGLVKKIDRNLEMVR